MPQTPRPSNPARAIFVLSLWCERAGEPWRAALRPADGGPRVGFGDLEQLAAFLLRLQDELAVAPAESAGPTTEGGADQHQADRPTSDHIRR